MRKRICVAGAALMFALATLATPAVAADVTPAPGYGRGSQENPMTAGEGSGNLPFPLFRVWNMCNYFNMDANSLPQRVWGRIWVDGGEWSLRSVYQRHYLLEADLHCLRFNLAANQSMTFTPPCGPWSKQVPAVYGSTAFSHGFGPIVLTAQRPDGAFVFTNFGWFGAEMDVWWLCQP